MAEVVSCCMACNVGPRCDECGCSLLVGYRLARDWALGAYLADERHGERSSAFAEASEWLLSPMGNTCGNGSLRAVLGMRELLASAGLWRGTCGESAVVGTHLSNNGGVVLSGPDV